jgi:hypothetical protein
MRIVKLMALLAAIVGGSLAVGGGAFATPLGSGTLATVPAQAAATTLVEKAQYYRRSYSRPRSYGYRPTYRSRYYYSRPRYVFRPRFYAPAYYRPRVVCRIRYGYYGRRRVCYRR